jgi:hypothetical protein
MENNKFICDKCDFKTNIKSKWNIHINTELHKTGKRKTRSDNKEPLYCDKCEYMTKNNTTLKKHILNKHSNTEERKLQFKYYCNYCNFGTFCNKTMEIHNNTDKHKHFITIKI